MNRKMLLALSLAGVFALPQTAVFADDGKQEAPKPELIAEGEEKPTQPAPELIAEGEDKTPSQPAPELITA